ncbi:flavoprotein [Actinoplanes aureus]|uniref:Flavoprotein n=1 Tax=Actinoplanes aureus TaxID=2792083 RepID=A0A931CEU9_9ACTN|nr:flavoprotein [Actinoplanes aureus]MBG0565898.1 flavoprotein [Actinoplanes aureus]
MPGLLHLVTCAATPLRRIGELLDQLVAARWEVQVIATPAAATWPFLTGVRATTGRPVLHRMPLPDEPWPVTAAAAVLVAPATFNTINKVAAGVNDNLAVGVLNEHLGGPVPVVMAAHVKPELRAHPAFARSRRFLTEAGVVFTDLGHPLDWTQTVAALDPHR